MNTLTMFALRTVRDGLRKLAAALALGLISHAALAQEADQFMKSKVDEVTAAIQADKAILDGDRQKLNQLVDAKIVPFLDFERMTKDAMGPNWSKAAPEQKKQLTAEFRTLLVRTYSGALAAYRPNTQIRYKPARDLGDGEKLVRSEVIQAGNEPIGLDYYMAKGDKGWMVYDITVFGARLVENYRSTFKTEIQNNGIDGLLKNLATMNKAADAKKG